MGPSETPSENQNTTISTASASHITKLEKSKKTLKNWGRRKSMQVNLLLHNKEDPKETPNFNKSFNDTEHNNLNATSPDSLPGMMFRFKG